jgi:hypothetical protein
MQLTIERAYELVLSHGVFARDCCDKCGRLLGAVRYTRRDDLGEWCSRECRGDAAHAAVHRGGRPRKHRSNADRQRAYRSRIQIVTKPVSTALQTDHLQTSKQPLSTIPLKPSIRYVFCGPLRRHQQPSKAK